MSVNSVPSRLGPRRTRQAPRGNIEKNKSKEKYWRAISPTYLYYGPLGDPIGKVSPGVVTRELFTYFDPFGDQWFAMGSTEGSVVWGRKFSCSAIGSKVRYPDWEYVLPIPHSTSKATKLPDKSITPHAAKTPNLGDSVSLSTSSSQNLPMEENYLGYASNNKKNNDEAFIPEVQHVLGQSLSDVPYYEYYWKNLSSEVNPLNFQFPGENIPIDLIQEHGLWNLGYQRIIENVVYQSEIADIDSDSSNEKNNPSRDYLNSLVSAFIEAAEDAMVRIHHALFHPEELTLDLFPHPQNIDIWYRKGILIRLVPDFMGNSEGNSEGYFSGKIIGQRYRSFQFLSHEAPKHFLYVPLVICLSYHGFHALASSIPPIQETNCIYAGPLHYSRLYANSSPLLSESSTQFIEDNIRRLAGVLHIKSHECNSKKMFMPSEMAIYSGEDHRLYIMHCDRIVPPVIFSSQYAKNHLPFTSSLCRLRPEFVVAHHKALNCDAFIQDSSTTVDNNEVLEATQWIRDIGIPTIVAMLSMHEAISFPVQKTISCSRCSREINDELRFLVCRNKNNCCKICGLCFLKLIDLEESEINHREIGSFLADSVKCGKSFRGPKGLILEPSISEIFHAMGVNLHFLPFVYYRLPFSARRSIGFYLEIEMIARAARRILSKRLRQAESDEQTETICAHFLLDLLCGNDSSAQSFWESELGPILQEMFSLYVPFKTSELDAELLYFQLSQMTGLSLSEASIESLHGDKPFLSISRYHPQSKIFHMPYLITSADDQLKKLNEALSSLILLWISEDERKKISKTPFYFSMSMHEPFYLQSSFLENTQE